MTAIESQDIILYAPQSNILTAVLKGICLPIGVALPFFTGWQFPVLVCSLFFILLGGGLGPFLIWKMVHDPILVINAEGIFSRASFFVKWEEVDSIYRLHARNRTAFAVDLSPSGVLAFFARRGMRIPGRMDVTVPQQALVIVSTNLSLPVDQLLSLIRERFSAQLERFKIDLDDGQVEGQEP
ncbi:MAG: hypothetical protein JO031_08890 [Ktedonobacteraceae bacterium]|nr:hypothetical protein [Ktedonobacteraceae bacterium]